MDHDISTEVGVVIGELSDELKGKHFKRGVFPCRKTYGLELSDGSIKVAAKGIPLPVGSEEKINPSTLTTLLFGEGPREFTAHEGASFKIRPAQWSIQTVPFSRAIACTYTGRIIGKNWITYPYGYQGIPFPQPDSDEEKCVDFLIQRSKSENEEDEYTDEIDDLAPV